MSLRRYHAQLPAAFVWCTPLAGGTSNNCRCLGRFRGSIEDRGPVGLCLEFRQTICVFQAGVPSGTGTCSQLHTWHVLRYFDISDSTTNLGLKIAFKRNEDYVTTTMTDVTHRTPIIQLQARDQPQTAEELKIENCTQTYLAKKTTTSRP